MKYSAIRCELVSWERVQRLALDLAFQIKTAGFKPDLVIAVARGGFVPARLLCDFLQVYELASIRVEHYTQGARRHSTARLKSPLSIDPSGMRVLIVDDVCDTGETYHITLEHVAGFAPAEVRTAALQHKAEANFMPDFIAQRIQKWRWLIFPWAVTEDVIGFIERMTEPPQSISHLKTRLVDDHGIRLSEARLKDILRLMEN